MFPFSPQLCLPGQHLFLQVPPEQSSQAVSLGLPVMAMGRRQHRERQEDLWVAHTQLASAPGHPFYERLNAVLDAEGFDRFVEDLCARFYAPQFGRPSLTPGIYFRSLLIGYFEGIGAERGIAWRLADSLALCGVLWASRWTRARRTTRRFRAPGG
jgi:hypothetical protein